MLVTGFIEWKICIDLKKSKFKMEIASKSELMTSELPALLLGQYKGTIGILQ